MNLKNASELNSDRFLVEAFDSKFRKKLIRAARLRRNVYLAIFLIGFTCIFVTGLTNRILLSILSLGLATLSLVVMTKYDTQLFFLKIIAKKEHASDAA